MGFLDALLGRTKQVAPNLDRLFGLPGARITLEATEGLRPTGNAGVCFKPAAGQEFGATEKELADLLRLGGDEPETSSPPSSPAQSDASPTMRLVENTDEFGYRWVVVSSSDFDTLVTRVHVVNSTLEEHGWGPQLLCSVFGFAQGPSGEGPTLQNTTLPASSFLVYLYKRGTFYPFVPTGSERRDNEAELRLKAELKEDLSMEEDLDRWFPLWKLPVH